MEEIEVKFLDIDVARLEGELSEAGAVKQFDRTYRRKVYDFPNLRLENDRAWVRVRDEGDTIRVAYKRGGEWTEEVEFEVSDFKLACLFFEKIGMLPKFSGENRRIRYRLNDTNFDIDCYPGLPPYVEVESSSWEQLEEAALRLSLGRYHRVPGDFRVDKDFGLDFDRYSEVMFERTVKKAD